MRLQPAVPGILQDHQPAAPRPPHPGRELPPLCALQVLGEPGLLPEAPGSGPGSQWTKPHHPAGSGPPPDLDPHLDLVPGKQNLLMPHDLLRLQHDGDSLPVYWSF